MDQGAPHQCICNGESQEANEQSDDEWIGHIKRRVEMGDSYARFSKMP